MWRLVFISLIIVTSCKNDAVVKEGLSPIFSERDTTEINTMGLGFSRLSEYGFFSGDLNKLVPAEFVYPYTLNAALFSDYAEKERFLYLPEGKKLEYVDDDNFSYPDGCILIKNFFYRNEDGGRQIVETRLLRKSEEMWQPLTYVWNESQTEAFFWPIGHNVEVYNNTIGSKLKYTVPDLNQCKNCHMKEGMVKPIGPSPANLNLTDEKSGINQLLEMKNVIVNIPDPKEITSYVDYNDDNKSLEDRARSYLHINCGSCHRSEGSAKTSGLDLTSGHDDDYALGINKAPIAAGKASGGRLYDIVPGKPDESILLYRMENNDPAIRMPEIGRKVVHTEGVALIRRWIAEL